MENTVQGSGQGPIEFGRYATGSNTVLYVYTVPGSEKHEGVLKIGDTTLHDDRSPADIIAAMEHDSSINDAIIASAHKRIKIQTQTVAVEYKLERAVLAAKKTTETTDDGTVDRWVSHRDRELHQFLARSGVRRAEMGDTGAMEWFHLTLDEFDDLYRRFQQGEPPSGQMRGSGDESVEITLRDEQVEAIQFTAPRLKLSKNAVDNGKRAKVLWNAAPRFGKTLTAYGLVKELKRTIKRVLILTHRPVTEKGWWEDCGKMLEDDGYVFSGRTLGANWEQVRDHEKLVQFVSIQAMRRWVPESEPATDEPGQQVSSLEPNLESPDAFGVIIGETSSETTDVSVATVGLSASPEDTTTETEPTAAELDALEDESPSMTETAHRMAEIYATEFDLVIVDEGHDGTTTELATGVINSVKSPRWLHLSGTPFNLMDSFAQEEVYTWDYVMEREAKERWDVEHPGEVNPYAGLPSLEIYAYDLGKNLSRYVDDSGTSDGFFNFAEFFRTKRTTVGSTVFGEVADVRFVHEGDVRAFLDRFKSGGDAGTEPTTERNFPFDSHDLKKHFAHTLWLLPSVDACAALERLLVEDNFFGGFEVVNVAGSGVNATQALSRVQEAVRRPFSVTLSAGRLTTGVTVPEWTGEFLLTNTKSPMTYIQAIFRVKSGGVLADGRLKEKGYVFDFSPIRALEMVAQAAAANETRALADELRSSLSGSGVETGDDADSDVDSDATGATDETELQEEGGSESGESGSGGSGTATERLLRYLPVIAWEGNEFKKIDTFELMTRVRRSYIEKAVNSGFDTPFLYNRELLGKVTADELTAFRALRGVVGKHEKGKSATGKDAGKIYINNSKLSEEQASLSAKRPSEVPSGMEAAKSEADKAAQKFKAEKRKQENSLIATLMAVSIRVPLMVFATNMESLGVDRITIDNFPDTIDDRSWEEFMPAGFTKDEGVASWGFIKRFYDRDVFEGACEAIRMEMAAADALDPISRLIKVIELGSKFKNPDKETVLTPARVVNTQILHTLGGVDLLNLRGEWRCADGVHRSDAERRAVASGSRLSDDGSVSRIVGAEGSLSRSVGVVSAFAGNDDSTAARIAASTVRAGWVDAGYDDLWADESATFFDFNSKTAMYPLFAAVNMWTAWKRELMAEFGYTSDEEWNRTVNQDWALWREIVAGSVFVNCRTPYAAAVARRVLASPLARCDLSCPGASSDPSVVGSRCYHGVNVSVVDILETRASITSVLRARASRPLGRTKSFSGALLAGLGVTVDELWSLIWRSIFNPEAYLASRVGSGDTVEERAARWVLPVNETEEEKMAREDELLRVLTEVKENPPAKFGVVVSNPPYQSAYGGNSTVSGAVYQHFAAVAQSVASLATLIHPSKWHGGGGTGEGLSDFRYNQLRSPHYVKFYDFPSGAEFFPPPVEIGGGVNFYLWDADKTEPLVEYNFGWDENDYRNTLADGMDFLIRSPRDAEIVHKISSPRSMRSIVETNSLFGGGGASAASLVMKKHLPGSPVECFLSDQRAPGGIRMVPVDIDSNVDEVKSWKVFASTTANRMSGGGGEGKSHPRHDRLFLGKPNQVASYSYKRIGDFSTRQEAVNCVHYLKTDFCNFLHALPTITQNTAKRNYSLIPLLDFATGEILDRPGTFLDFTHPESLDNQLAEIYGLTPEDREIMAKDLKPWKNKLDLSPST